MNALDINPEVQNLLKKPVWTKADREKWEEILSDTTSRIVNEQPGYGDYRSASEEGVERIQNLNNTNRHTEMDCEVFGAIEGSIIQMAENAVLGPYRTKDPRAWKQPLGYFRASGGLSEAYDTSQNEYLHSSHVWIVTPTGNIIDPTHDPDKHGGTPYRKSAYSLESLARGEAAYIKQGDKLYGSYIKGSYAWSAHSEIRENLPERVRLPEIQLTNATKTNNGLFALERRARKNGYIYVPVRKMDIGTPNERYEPLDQKFKRGDGEYSFRYRDELSGYTYRFSFQDGAAKIERFSHEATIFSSDYWNWEDVTASVEQGISPGINSIDEKYIQFRDNIQEPAISSDALAAGNAHTVKNKHTI